MEQVKDAWAKVNRFHDSLNLSNPGTFEGVNREVKSKSFEEEEWYRYFKGSKSLSSFVPSTNVLAFLFIFLLQRTDVTGGRKGTFVFGNRDSCQRERHLSLSLFVGRQVEE